MASAADEYAGTDNGGGADGGNTGGDTRVSFDPANLGGNGSGGDAASGGSDDFVYNSDGTVKRNKDGSPRRKRGRKAGGGNASRAGTSAPRSASDLKASVDALTSMLTMVHFGIATVSATPEMALSEDEAKLLANAAVPVLEQFDFTPDPRFTAVFGLMVASAQVYGPRVYLIRARKAKEAEDARARRARPIDGTEGASFAPPPFGTVN